MKNKIIIFLCISMGVVLLTTLGIIIKNYIEKNNKVYKESYSQIQEIDEKRLEKEDINIDLSKFEFLTETFVKFVNNEAEISGKGAIMTRIEDINTLKITESGSYRLSGMLDDGRIVVDAKEGFVNLILDNINITCLNSAPIYVYESDTTMITLSDGASNSISDGREYIFLDEISSSEEEEPNSCLYSKSDLIIYGTGELNVNAINNNGITSKDTLYIENAKIIVNAENHGINGKDSNVIKNAEICVYSSGDGLRSTNDTDTTLGWIRIENSEITINAGEDAIQAETDLIINGGTYSIVAGEGSSKVSIDQPNNVFNKDKHSFKEIKVEDVEEISRKGLKATRSIKIENAVMNIDAHDDTVHSNENIKIMSGNYVLSTDDDAVHADGSVIIESGYIKIEKSYEGIEGTNIIINGGDINITSSDDGINVNGGNEFLNFGNIDKGGRYKFSGDMNGMRAPDFIPDEMKNMVPPEFKSGDRRNSREFLRDNGKKIEDINFMNTSENTSNILIINGGTIIVDANGDGIDSNGSILMNGGEVMVLGPTNSGNGALDYASKFEMNGGELVAVGSSGMAMYPSENSNQTYIVANVQNQSGNSKIVLKDSKENEISSYNISKPFSNLVISSSKLQKDESYEVYINDEKITNVVAGEKINNRNKNFQNINDIDTKKTKSNNII